MSNIEVQEDEYDDRLAYAQIGYQGRTLGFSLTPHFFHLPEPYALAQDATFFIGEQLKDEGSEISWGSWMGWDKDEIDSLDDERPIAVIVNSDDDGAYISKPGEFEETETILSKYLLRYLREIT